MKRILSFILILAFACIEVHAQKGLAIQSAFDELAAGKNVTEVVMGAGRLKKYNLSLFHSLEIKMPTAPEQQRVEALVQTDVPFQSIVSSGFAATSLLGESAGGYVLVAVISFVAAVCITAYCIRRRKN